MIRRLLALIGLGGRERTPSPHLAIDEAWTFSEIRDKHRFLRWVLSAVPDGTIWSIEGVSDPAILYLAQEFSASDGVQIPRATIWPRQNTMKLLLTPESKERLSASLQKWDLDRDLIHQHIYSDAALYFRSYDNLHESCTWVSRLISRDQLEPLLEDNVASLA